MSAPKFYIEENSEYNGFAEILSADKEAKHFVKKKSFSECKFASHEDLFSFYDKNTVNHTEGGSFKLMLLFFSLFVIMFIISYFTYSKAEKENLLGFIPMFIITAAFGIAFIIFTYCHFYEHKSMVSESHLFVVYDTNGTPCSIEIKHDCIKVLYNNKLYLIKNSEVKEISAPSKIYLAYVNMLPTSLLNIEQSMEHLESFSSDYDISIVPNIVDLKEGSCSISLNVFKNREKNGEIKDRYLSKKDVNKFLHFSKYYFIIDENLKLQSVYYSAKENNLLLDHIFTFANIAERGDSAAESLKQFSNKHILLEKVLKQIGI